jgi:signal transduction histidine kinase
MSAERLDSRLPRLETADELAELGHAFNGLLDRLQKTFERQRRFTAEASHQLRTPLTAILGQVEVAQRRERSGDEYRRVLTIVRKQGGHLRELVEKLLYLARAGAEGRLPDLEPLDLCDWTPKLLADWSSHPRSSDVRWAPAAQPPCWINASPPLLAEAVKNLLDNAVKYSKPGQPVEVGLHADYDVASLSVTDRGDGISAEDQLHLFEPFFRSAEARRKGAAGVGLGLAVVARLVKAMGGRIEVRSRLGEGSCFAVVFPTSEITLVERALTRPSA